MVISKHKAVHGKAYRKKSIAYILNPEKTNNLEYVSDYGMLNELDWKDFDDYVMLYDWNFNVNDERYQKVHDRLFDKNNEIYAHHLIQSFSPDDNLSPGEVNRIGWETAKQISNGRFRFIVATHVDKDHIHNHILINAVDIKSQKKFEWNFKRYDVFKAISDSLAREAGAKIVEPSKFTYTDYQLYRKNSHKYELKQRLNYLLRHSKNLVEFLKNAIAMNVKIDFSGKHTTYTMTDRGMKKVIRGDKISKKTKMDFDYYKSYFAKQEIQRKLEFLLNHSTSFQDLKKKAELLNLNLKEKTKKVDFVLTKDDGEIVINSDELSKKISYDLEFFEDYFSKLEVTNDHLLSPDLVEAAYSDFENEFDVSIESDQIYEEYKKEKAEKDEQDLFEVELEDWQIEREVDQGIYIKVYFGLDSEGLVFIPNNQLEIEMNADLEKRYRIFLDEKKYYYLYDKDYTEKNRFVMGKTMIRQLTGERQKIPHRKFVTEKTLKVKMNQINLLLQLNVKEKSYQDIKEDLVSQMAQKELKMTELNQKIDTLNQVAELLAGCESEDPDIQRRSRLELAKLNVSSTITYEQIEQQIREVQDELYGAVAEYEQIVRQMETFIDLLKQYNSESDEKEREEREKDGVEL